MVDKTSVGDIVEIAFSMGGTGDVGEARSLLAAAGLPDEDVALHIQNFLLARRGKRLVGSVGLEILGFTALLRSLCVEPELRGLGIAGVLCDRISASARAQGVSRLYLLTTTAKSFFEHRGFVVVERDGVPAEVRATTQFQSCCPSTATCMTKHLLDAPSESRE